MASIQFPKMFSKTSTKIIHDYDATKQNAILVLRSEETGLFGDPYFGTKLKNLIFNPNNIILKDVVIDEIYTKLAIFMPQLIINRRDMNITFERAKLYCTFKARYVESFELNTYSLYLMDTEKED